MDDSPGDITMLLSQLSQGNQAAEEELVALIYKQLRRIASNQMRFERPDHTLQPTALVHEAYVRLLRKQRVDWKNRAHFFAIASTVMRQILVDDARRRFAGKRTVPPGRGEFEPLSKTVPAEHLIALDDALKKLSTFDERQSRIVEMLFFGGLTEEEAAEVLGISSRTVKRDWQAARAWLHIQMEGGR
jgi:RNA polymerase sigma factor (TIGR02999 family)